MRIRRRRALALPGAASPLLRMIAARWVVLLPGAAQQSTTVQPGAGDSAWAGMQEALLWSTTALFVC